MTNYTTQVAVPQSFITRGKQRLKQYVDTVYLNNGDEFQIELYNPTQNKVLAKIELNGNSIGSGIILRPGERVFLERYLDEARKFLFETYNVNGTKEEIKNAIANNGNVVVKFYTEQQPFYWNSTNWNYPWYNNGITLNGLGYGTLTSTAAQNTNTLTNNIGRGVAGITSTNVPAGVTYTNTSLNNSASSFTVGMDTLSNNAGANDIVRSGIKSKKSLVTETGRVEKGSSSNQSFILDSSNFNSWYSWVNNWKILPVSQKQLVKEDLVVYCTNCGTKKKKDSFNYCPTCGTKF